MNINLIGITIIFIILSTVAGILSRRLARDKCLKDFNKNPVLVETDNDEIEGRMNIFSTGMEIVYPKGFDTKDKIEKRTYLIYKSEYNLIKSILRFYDDLNDKEKAERKKSLVKTYHPKFFARVKRDIKNIFKTVKDSIVEILNLIIGQFKAEMPKGSMLLTQDKYVNKMKNEFIDAVPASYEPLIERYIGNRVFFDYLSNGKILKCTGVLKEYSSGFIQFMNVDMEGEDKFEGKIYDAVFPRKLAVVRHLGEVLKK